MINILFVCTGNVCRSPMAYGFCKKTIEERHLTGFTCSSCGLYPIKNDKVTENAVLAVQKYGIDISNHTARKISAEIIKNSDLIVCMTAYQANTVSAISGDGKKIIVLGYGVSDPYGGSIDVYNACAAQIKAAVECLMDMLTMKIVPMDESCIDSIAEIERECFSVPWTDNNIAEELTNDNAHFLVAKSNSVILGYIGVTEIADEAYISNIAVRKCYRQHGIGELLLTLAEKGALKRGCKFISLEVRESNTVARNLYKKHKYEVAGVRKSYYHNPDEDALIMTLYFNKIPLEG